MIDDSVFRDESTEKRLTRKRTLLLAAVFLIAIGGLVLRYQYLQIEQHERFSTQSDDNRIHVRAVPAPRGLIFDRNGVLLADNQPSYILAVVVEHTPNRNALLDELATIVELKETDRERFLQQLQKPRRPFEPIPLKTNLSELEVAALAVREHQLPGVTVQVELSRHYPMPEYFSHLVGYVGRINERDLERIDTERYAGTHVLGKLGIEQQYESELLGHPGFEYVETDARGRVLRVLERHNPDPGDNIYLHVDSRLQVAVQDLLAEERASVVMLDIETGGVLAFISTPGFDSNEFVSGISSALYNSWLHDPDRPLFNRALQGQYPPGSTIKPIFGLIGLEVGAIDESFSILDPGFFRLPNFSRPFRDWKREGHGRVDLTRAIQESCDTYFYEMGYRMGIDDLAEYSMRFGLGVQTGIDLPGERIGIMPSRDWKQGARGEPWYPGDTINTSIGQGYMLTTPLQLAQATAVLARNGRVLAPTVVQRLGEEPVVSPQIDEIEFQSTNLALVQEAMRRVVHVQGGTAFNSIGRSLTGYQMAGKSGTAQVISVAADVEYDDLELEKRLRDHALFVAYAPIDNPQVAIAVIVENGEGGSSLAGPIARGSLDAWFALYPEAIATPDQSP